MNKPPLLPLIVNVTQKAIISAQRDATYEDMERQHKEIVAEIFRVVEANALYVNRKNPYWQELKKKYGGSDV